MNNYEDFIMKIPNKDWKMIQCHIIKEGSNYHVYFSVKKIITKEFSKLYNVWSYKTYWTIL